MMPVEKLPIKGFVKKILTLSKTPMSPTQIWAYACEHDLDKESAMTTQTPVRSIATFLLRDVVKKNSIFQQVFYKPARYGLKNMVYSDDSIEESFETPQPIKKKSERREINLHPVLVEYVHDNSHFKCHCKTIDAATAHSDKHGENKWRYPDIVGVHFAFEDVKSDNVLCLIKQVKQPTMTLYSFELKLNVTLGNAREYYFQAISNSSWSNEGYLVAGAIEEDAFEELSSLNQSFGIGVILLNEGNPEDSQIIYPARYNEKLDINAINRLSLNKDFNSFMDRINKDVTNKEINPLGYDSI
ncbi:MAG: hypothetical protein AB7E75_02330 [Candidatus Methanomethylophilaceae archaeon]